MSSDTLTKEELTALLAELEPRIMAVAARTRRFSTSDDALDQAQHLREHVVGRAPQYAVASPALRNCMLRAAAISRLRKERSRMDGPTGEEPASPSRPLPGMPVAAPAAEQRLVGNEMFDQLCRALAELAPNELQAFLDGLDGVSSADTAARLGVADDTVRYYRTRIVHKLREISDVGSIDDLKTWIETFHDAQ